MEVELEIDTQDIAQKPNQHSGQSPATLSGYQHFILSSSTLAT